MLLSKIKQSAAALLSVALCTNLWACAAQPEKLAFKRTESKPFATISQTYRFIAFGDWGAGTPFQKEVAAQTVTQYKREPFDAVLMLGDNIYEKGDVKTYGRAYFTETYGPLIDQGVQFIVALGNHDRVGGFQDDQVKFFKMPGYYYEVHKPNVDIFVIESNLFASDAKQQAWLQEALKDSKAPWKIVMGHHPIYSSGEHGVNGGLQRTLEPLLQRYNVPLYLAGHDHDYERFQPIGGVQYIVSGGGGAYLRGEVKKVPESRLYIKAHHFLSFQMTPTTLAMQAINAKGQEMDRLEMTRTVRKR